MELSLTHSALDHIKMRSDMYNNSWLGFLKILNYMYMYVPKEREKNSAKNEPSFVTVKSYNGSQELF